MAVHVNARQVYKRLFGLDSEPARIAIIGDDETALLTSRAYAGILNAWPFNWSGLAGAATMLTPSLGCNYTQIAGATRTSVDMGDTFGVNGAGLTTVGTQITQYHITGNVGDGTAFSRVQHNTAPSVINAAYDNFDAASTMRYRGVIRTGPGAAVFDNGSFRCLHIGQVDSGDVALPTTPTNSIVAINATSPKNATPANFNVEHRGGAGDETNLNLVCMGGVYGEDAGSGKFTQTPGRGMLMVNITRVGANLTDYADETNFGGSASPDINWSWSDFGDVVDAHGDGAEDEAPNLFIWVAGHNDAADPTSTADIATAIGTIITQTNSEYSSRGYALPQILFVHPWQTNTANISVARWTDVWNESFVPNAGGNVAVISIAEFQSYVLHSAQLDGSDLHPLDTAGAAFFFGETGLLGALRLAGRARGDDLLLKAAGAGVV